MGAWIHPTGVFLFILDFKLPHGGLVFIGPGSNGILFKKFSLVEEGKGVMKLVHDDAERNIGNFDALADAQFLGVGNMIAFHQKFLGNVEFLCQFIDIISLLNDIIFVLARGFGRKKPGQIEITEGDFNARTQFPGDIPFEEIVHQGFPLTIPALFQGDEGQAVQGRISCGLVQGFFLEILEKGLGFFIEGLIIQETEGLVIVSLPCKDTPTPAGRP